MLKISWWQRPATDFAEATNTVGDHDTVVQRVTDHRHQRCHNGQVNLDMEKRQYPQRNDHVAVRQRDDHPAASRHLKAETDINEDTRSTATSSAIAPVCARSWRPRLAPRNSIRFTPRSGWWLH